MQQKADNTAAPRIDFDTEIPACSKCPRDPKRQSPAQCVDGPLVIEDLAWRATRQVRDPKEPWKTPRCVRDKENELWRGIFQVRAEDDPRKSKKARIDQQAARLASRCRVPRVCARCILRVNPKKLCYRSDD